jgi:gas vesicle protein
MSITNEKIREYFAEKQVKSMFDPEMNSFILIFGSYVLMMRIEEEGEFIQLRTLGFFNYIGDEQHYGNKDKEIIILKMISQMNTERKLVKFGYDPEDGEINAMVDICIEDSTFTSTQLFRCLAAILQAMDEARLRILHILENGKDLKQTADEKHGRIIKIRTNPGGKVSKEVLDKLVADIAEHINEEVEQNEKINESSDCPPDSDEDENEIEDSNGAETEE